jgi:hypothetical protein
MREAVQANDPAAWRKARDQANRALKRGRADHADAQRSHHDVSSLAHLRAAFDALEQELGAQQAPLGYRPLVHESRVLAVLQQPAPIAAMELALRAELRRLPAADLVELQRRLSIGLAEDPVALAWSALDPKQRSRLAPHLEATVRANTSVPSPHEHRAGEATLADPGGEHAFPTNPLAARLQQIVQDAEPSLLLVRVNELVLDADGTERRQLVRRLETYRPGNGDALAAHVHRLAPGIRSSLLGILAAPTVSSTGSPTPLPFADAIQRSFGRHSLASVRAQIGGAAGEAALRIGARAFALGEMIAFSAPPDLHTAAHEAAHVVQQRAGNVGADSESHADRVADAVVRGESAETILDEVATGSGSGAVAVIQRKEVTAPEAAAPPALPQLRKGEHYRAIPGQLAYLVDVPWFLNGASRLDDMMVAPANMVEILLYLRASGVLGWASPESLFDAAQTLGIPQNTKATELTIRIGARALGKIGLPPDASATVSVHAEGLQVAVRAETDGLAPGSEAEVRGSTVDAVYRALESFTGFPIPADARRDSFWMRVGNGAMYRSVSYRTLEDLLGKAAFSTWRQAGAHAQDAKASVGAVTVARELTPHEHERVAAWLITHLGMTPSETGATLSRDLLQLIDDIDYGPHSQHRATILAELRARGRHAPELSGASIRSIVETAVTTAERLTMGAVTAAELAAQRKSSTAPLLAEPLPAHMTYTRGLLLDGDNVTFEVDFDYRHIGADAYDAFAHHAWNAEVEWVFKRTDKRTLNEVAKTSHQSSTIRVDHVLKLDPGEIEGRWLVHAFVRTSHFPLVHVTAPVEIKSEGLRMAELRNDVLGGERGPMPTEQNGRWSGPLPFEPRTSQAREAERAQAVDTLVGAQQYLQSLDKDRHAEAIKALGRQVDRQREQDKAIREDQADGWHTFDVRATYLSKVPQVPSGALDIYGAAKYVQFGPLDKVIVKLRDHSRRFEQEVYEFEESGPTFEAALQRAFANLAKDYPKGKIALFAEELDEHGQAATGQVVGFERATWSTWNAIKAKVFDPVAQVAMNAVLTALAIFVPGGAAIAVPIMIANTTVQSVDDLVTRAENHTLTGRRAAMNMGTIALSVLPYARNAAPIRGSRAALYAFTGLEATGNVLLMREQVRETLASLQSQDVAVIAQMYSELVELQKTLADSDPRLRELQEEIEQRAAATRGRLADAFSLAMGEQLMFMVPGHVFASIKAGAHGAPTAESGWVPSDLGTPLEHTDWHQGPEPHEAQARQATEATPVPREHQTSDRQSHWAAARADIAAGVVPHEASLPTTDGNRAGLARLRDVLRDPHVPDQLRNEFLRELSAHLESMPDAPLDLHAEMKNIAYGNPQKYLRQGPRLTPNDFRQLGGLRRALSLKWLCSKATAALLARAAQLDPSIPSDPRGYTWPMAQKVVDLIRTGKLAFDPLVDVDPAAMVGDWPPGASGWYFAGGDVADGISPQELKTQLAVGPEYADGYQIAEVPQPLAVAGSGAFRPTALDLTLAKEGLLNPDLSEPYGRTNPQADGQVPTREVLMAPLPISQLKRGPLVMQ